MNSVFHDILRLSIGSSGPFLGINGLIPHPLPVAVQDLAKEYEHHVLMEFAEYSDGEVGRLTAALDKLVASSPEGALEPRDLI